MKTNVFSFESVTINGWIHSFALYEIQLVQCPGNLSTNAKFEKKKKTKWVYNLWNKIHK